MCVPYVFNISRTCTFSSEFLFMYLDIHVVLMILHWFPIADNVILVPNRLSAMHACLMKIRRQGTQQNW